MTFRAKRVVFQALEHTAMSMIPAQISLMAATAVDRAPARRWPRAVGLGLAALVSLALWAGAISALRHLI